MRSSRRRNLTGLLLGIVLAGLSTSSMAVDAVVVRPAGWKDAVGPWLRHRASQGFDIAEVDAEIGREAILATIARLYAADAGRFRFVLLASDVGSKSQTGIPTFHRDSTAMVQFGGDPVIATDHPYGEVDGDNIPDLAVGRIPADSAAQLRQVLARVIQYENNQNFSNWRRQVHVVAGIGGFGVVADSVIEMTTRRFLADRIPGWADVSMTHASIGSHYCPDPWRFSEVCINRFNQGGMFWVYIGHGSVRTLDYFKVKQEFLPILTTRHVPAMDTEPHPPIAIFLACYTGAFDAREDSLAEELVLQDKGPIAAIAASRVSGPYGLAFFSDGLLRSCYELQRPTLGEIVLSAKRSLLTEPVQVDTPNSTKSSSQMQMVGAIATALSPEDYDLSTERAEHVWQMHLIGDPMLRINYPTLIELDVPKQAAPGATISVRGTSAAAGQLTLELAYLRGQVRRELDEIVVDLDTQSGRNRFQQRYEIANDPVIAKTDLNCQAGPFVTQIDVPSDLPRGRYCVRAYGTATTGWQVGYAEIRIRPSRIQPPRN